MAAMPTGRYTVGNQVAMIRRSFEGRNLEGLALAGGAHPGQAMNLGNLRGLGVDLTTLYPSLPSAASIPGPSSTFSTTVTSPAPGMWDQIIGGVSNFITSRWGQQRGTITYNPDGTITQKQAAGVPISTQAPLIIGGTIPGQQTAAGMIGGGISMGTVLLLGGGLLMVTLLSRGGGRR